MLPPQQSVAAGKWLPLSHGLTLTYDTHCEHDGLTMLLEWPRVVLIDMGGQYHGCQIAPCALSYRRGSRLVRMACALVAVRRLSSCLMTSSY